MRNDTKRIVKYLTDITLWSTALIYLFGYIAASLALEVVLLCVLIGDIISNRITNE